MLYLHSFSESASNILFNKFFLLLSFKIVYHSYSSSSGQSGNPCPVSVGETIIVKAIFPERGKISCLSINPFGEPLYLVSVGGTSMVNTVCQYSGGDWVLSHNPRQKIE